MKRHWWKLIVVAALVVAVAVAIAVKDKVPSTGTRVAKDTGASTPVENSGSENKSGGQAQETPSQPEAATDADKPTSTEAVDERSQLTRAATSDKGSTQKPGKESAKAAARKPEPKPAPKPAKTSKRLPRIVDLGATKCIPCKMMAPILQELEKEYKGKLEVVFIDVWQDREEGAKYGVETIPTQIFFDENGKEFFRHTGFLSKEDILKTFAERGIKL